MKDSVQEVGSAYLRQYIRIYYSVPLTSRLEASWNVVAQEQKPVFVFRRNERVNLNRGGVSSVDYWQPRCAHQLLLSVVMLDIPCSEVVWRVLSTHSIRQIPLHFPSRGSQCAITFQLESTCLSLRYRTVNSSSWNRKSIVRSHASLPSLREINYIVNISFVNYNFNMNHKY